MISYENALEAVRDQGRRSKARGFDPDVIWVREFLARECEPFHVEAVDAIERAYLDAWDVVGPIYESVGPDTEVG